MKVTKTNVVKIVKTIRKEKGFSQADLAKRFGMSKSWVSALENRRLLPSENVINKVTRLFGKTKTKAA